MSMAAAFIAGVSGSLHCLAMCGGISSALGMRARAMGGDAAHTVLHAVLYHVGRLLSYSVLGALGGAVGASLLHVLSSSAMVRSLRLAAGVFMIALGCQMLFAPRLLAPLEMLGYRLWRKVMPQHITGLQPAAATGSVLQTLLLGALWVWLPCGLVYSMLLLGVLGASPVDGAGIMLSFGVGTLPLMLSSSLLAGQWRRVIAQQWQLLGGSTLLILGAWTSFSALQHVH